MNNTKTYPEITSDKFKKLKHVIKKNNKDKLVVKIKGYEIGSKFSYILGPCAIENKSMYEETAKHLKKMKIPFIRGGAYKLRTSPYDFQGLEKEGLQIIKEVCDKYNLVSFSEIPSTEVIEYMKDMVDVLVIGARNMQNISMLKEVGKVKNPIMLKRGPGATILELLASAEYIIEMGNPNVILCERGIRSFENYNRYTLDLGGACALLNITRLPIIIDPSHATGRSELVRPLARASKAINSDGIMVEYHIDPKNAKSDSMQAISFLECEKMVEECEKIKFR